MRPKQPPAAEFDGHYQTEPHFKPTPGLTEIPPHSKNYRINQELKPKISALYRKHNLTKGTNYGLFYAGWPKWTMIKDRDKMVLLVLEMLQDQISDWHKLDKEARKLLSDYHLTGVTVRYYKFSAGWTAKKNEEQRIANEIRERERGLRPVLPPDLLSEVSSAPLTPASTASPASQIPALEPQRIPTPPPQPQNFPWTMIPGDSFADLPAYLPADVPAYLPRLDEVALVGIAHTDLDLPPIRATLLESHQGIVPYPGFRDLEATARATTLPSGPATEGEARASQAAAESTLDDSQTSALRDLLPALHRA